MNEKKAKYIASIIEIAILLFIAVSIIVYIIFNRYASQINNLGIKAANNDTVKSYINSRKKKVVNRHLKVYIPILNGIKNLFGNLLKNMNSINTKLSPINQFINNSTKDFYKKIEISTQGTSHLVNNLKVSTNKLVKDMKEVFDTIENTSKIINQDMSKNNISSELDKPNPILDKLICFHPDTIIGLKNNTHVKIKNIKVNDILTDSSIVIATHKFKNKNYLYDYLGVLVTEFHKVYENNNWIDVSDSNISTKTDIISEYVHCISTNSSVILIGNILFKDYGESNIEQINYTINNLILNKLNNYKIECSKFSFPVKYLELGLDENTIIKTKSGKKAIRDIDIGEILTNNNKVLGKIEINPLFFKFYKFNHIILSSNFKIYYNNIWQNIEVVPEAIEVKKPLKAFHLTTEKGTFYSILDTLLQDYNETNDLFVNRKIDELIKLI